MPASLLARLERLETALGDSGGTMACPICRARPPVVGPWTTEVEPDHCPVCCVPWTRWSFTLHLGPVWGLVDTDER